MDILGSFVTKDGIDTGFYHMTNCSSVKHDFFLITRMGKRIIEVGLFFLIETWITFIRTS